jgi:hypothetical protein
LRRQFHVTRCFLSSPIVVQCATQAHRKPLPLPPCSANRRAKLELPTSLPISHLHARLTTPVGTRDAPETKKPPRQPLSSSSLLSATITTSSLEPWLAHPSSARPFAQQPQH